MRVTLPRRLDRKVPRRGKESAFTMIEIALSIAVVAFAMVAILGVLPTGLQVQKDNREETIINADGAYLLEAIRSGHDRAGLLSNSVYFLRVNYKDGSSDVIVADDNEPLKLDGQRMVGLLSTPKSTQIAAGVSNVVIWMRALNSTAIDRDADARDVAFRYQTVLEIEPFLAHPPRLTNGLGTNDLYRIVNLQRSLYEVRMTMRWPLFNDVSTDAQRARVGTHRRTFRSQIAGSQLFYPTNVLGMERLVYFFQPSLY